MGVGERVCCVVVYMLRRVHLLRAVIRVWPLRIVIVPQADSVLVGLAPHLACTAHLTCA